MSPLVGRSALAVRSVGQTGMKANLIEMPERHQRIRFQPDTQFLCSCVHQSGRVGAKTDPDLTKCDEARRVPAQGRSAIARSCRRLSFAHSSGWSPATDQPRWVISALDVARMKLAGSHSDADENGDDHTSVPSRSRCDPLLMQLLVAVFSPVIGLVQGPAKTMKGRGRWLRENDAIT